MISLKTFVRNLTLPTCSLLALTLAMASLVGCGGDGPTDSCASVTCNQPPAATCASPTVLRTYAPQGSCADGTCSYQQTDVVCQNGCEGDHCAGDPCGGVVCNQPPANTCADGSNLRVYAPIGNCGSGTCAYGSNLVVCPGGCANGQCVADPCMGVTCKTPDANRCDDPTHLRVFEATGTCGMGACIYQSTVQTCSAGCDNGKCKADPCAGVTCTTPPASLCEGASLRVFNAVGTCGAGTCAYGSTLRACAQGCENGQCKADPCTGVQCTTPEANHCDDATHLHVFDAVGTCGATGQCSYNASVTTCALGCDNGHCVSDPCAGVTCNTPTANSCDDATHLRTYASSGTCAQGTCSYAPTVTTCDFGCEAGHCKNNPCTGVTCNMPDADRCDDSTHLRKFSAAGVCQGGSCMYTSTLNVCTFGCVGGRCKDLCDGVVCVTPPSTCSDATHLQVYVSSGCSLGQCQVTSTTTACQFGCSNGACNPSTCVEQSLKASCVVPNSGGACQEFRGSAYNDPSLLAQVCPGYALTACSHANTPGACLTQCGTANEFAYYYPSTKMEAAAKSECSAINGIWIGK